MVDPSNLIPCCRNSRVRPRVSAFCNLAYAECGDSSPIQIQETPSATSSSMVYLRMALTEENTYSSQLFPAFCISSSNCMARLR